MSLTHCTFIRYAPQDVILVIKGRNIPWKKENDISVLPENLHKFETAKYRTINSVKQIECKFLKFM